MDKGKIVIVGGPDKPALQWALAYPEEHDVHFRVDGNAFDARVVHMDEQSDGFTFALRGYITSGDWKDLPFEAVYSIESRSGWVRVNH